MRLAAVQETIGHFAIREMIGRGGMGTVYRALDLRLRREVALKVLSEAFAGDGPRLRHLEAEARVLASLNHPNIAAIYGLEEADGAPVLVMEYVNGTTLAEMIRGDPIPPERTVALAAQMCEALAAAHDRGIVHRDVKPSNVKVTPDGWVKLLDFGLASPGAVLSPAPDASTDPDETRLVLPSVVGTIPYMAPEQILREVVDARTDVYALGVVLYEMATGRHPYAPAAGHDLIRAILHADPESPRDLVPDLPGRLERCIVRCLHKNPGDRFASMRELAGGLRPTPPSLTGPGASTTNVDAYERYLKARHSFRQFRRRSIEFACRLLEQAIAIDPDYAPAHAALADCHSYLFMFWEATEEHRKAAEEASRRAVELDLDLAEAYAARGVAASLKQDYDDADRDFERATRLDPRLFEAHYFRARGHYARGHLDEAVRWFEEARRARPEDYQAPILEASALAGLGREDDSRRTYREGLDLAERHLDLDPGDTRALYFGALALCRIGETRRSEEWAERALAMDPAEPQVLYNVGCVYALLGRPDEALRCLADALTHGGWWRTWMRNDPDLVSLADDPRFRELTTEQIPSTPRQENGDV